MGLKLQRYSRTLSILLACFITAACTTSSVQLTALTPQCDGSPAARGGAGAGVVFSGVAEAASLMAVQNVNSRIVKHFQGLEFKGAIIRPYQSVSGFLYFQIPEDGETLQILGETKTLQNLKVEIVTVADLGGQDVSFTVQIPNVDLSTPATR